MAQQSSERKLAGGFSGSHKGGTGVMISQVAGHPWYEFLRLPRKEPPDFAIHLLRYRQNGQGRSEA